MEKTNTNGTQSVPQSADYAKVLTDALQASVIACNQPVRPSLPSDLVETIITDEDERGEERCLFQWGNTPFIVEGDIVSVKAKSKAGKTWAVSLFAEAFLAGQAEGGLYSTATPSETILWIDTEQRRRKTAQIRRAVANHVGAENAQRIVYCNMRHKDADGRLQGLVTLTAHYNPTVIVIDGIADFLQGMDYNDQAQASKVLELLQSIAEGGQTKRAIFAVIHENRSDGNATGWLGRLLGQKCGYEMRIERDRDSDTRKITCAMSRDLEASDIRFTIDADGAHIVTSEAANNKPGILGFIRWADSGLTYAQLQAEFLRLDAYDKDDEQDVSRAIARAKMKITRYKQAGKIEERNGLYFCL